MSLTNAQELEYLNVSDGTGDAVLMHITANRTEGVDLIAVDSVASVPQMFIGTTGTLLSTGYIDPTTKMDFFGHLSDDNLIIDQIGAGSTDVGNTSGQVVVVKPNSLWSNLVAGFISATASQGFLPSGSLLSFAGPTAPSGFLLAQGQAVSRTTYATLFGIIGTTYGAGDGSTTFNLPNLQGNVPVGLKGADSNFASLGQTGGEEMHTLVQGEIPAYGLTVNDPGHSHGVYDPGHSHYAGQDIVFIVGSSTVALYGTSESGHTNQVTFGNFNTSSSGTGIGIYGSGTGINVQSAGGGAAHNNLQPYITTNYIIKT